MSAPLELLNKIARLRKAGANVHLLTLKIDDWTVVGNTLRCGPFISRDGRAAFLVNGVVVASR